MEQGERQAGRQTDAHRKIERERERCAAQPNY